MQLVIVESPAKAKTIEKYLGKDFKVLASYGHIRDLPPKDGSVRPDEDFAMDWEIYSDQRKRSQVKAIADAAKGAEAGKEKPTEKKQSYWAQHKMYKYNRYVSDAAPQVSLDFRVQATGARRYFRERRRRVEVRARFIDRHDAAKGSAVVGRVTPRRGRFLTRPPACASTGDEIERASSRRRVCRGR